VFSISLITAQPDAFDYLVDPAPRDRGALRQHPQVLLRRSAGVAGARVDQRADRRMGRSSAR
jgi:hypothetical protein